LIEALTAGLAAHNARGKEMAEIRVPTLGESVTEATIGRWFKKAGDAVAVDEPLVELETDKVTIEVPAPAGTLNEIVAKDGETVAVGALLGQITEGAGGAKPAAAPAKAAEPPKAAAPAAAHLRPPRSRRRPMPQAPSVRKLSAESGVDASTVPGSGKDGRVTKGDMLAAIEKAASLATPLNQPAAAVQVRATSPTMPRAKSA
jgi:2-oxoglutarate dehydrogenase E2 component (dihydrolipoamide succinyltransferase)